MKSITIAITGLILASATAYAGETLNAAAVKNLVSGNTAVGETDTGTKMMNYFSPDGTLHRKMGKKMMEGTWEVKDDGTQCIEGVPGGCATIVKNDDGTYDRMQDGVSRLKWTEFKSGKAF